jgi:hypothetical protein
MNMKKISATSLFAAVAALLSLASPAVAGTLTVNAPGPIFTPDTAFINNTIQVEVISNPPGVMGDLARISGGATVSPPGTNLARVDISGTYSANPGDTASVAYAFTADSNSVNPVQYTISGTIEVPIVGTVPFSTSGTIVIGLHQYKGEVQVPASFPVAASGNFTGTLSLDFSGPTAPVAASGTLDLVVQQLDIQLAPTAAALPPPSKSLNISTRGDVETGDDVLIGGFIITGTQPKQVVISALGPSLALVGVSGALADPVLELHDSSGALITTNDNWMENSAEDQMVLTDNGLAPTDDLESALVMALDPGTYTAIVRGVSDGTGVALVQLYDLSANTDGQLANISTRGLVQTGDNILDGGFILGPDTNGGASVVVRAIGPSLASQNVSNPLLDPLLEVHNQNGDIIASNDNWADGSDAQTITDDGLNPSDPNESALLLIPQPGQFTAVVSGVGDTTGVGLVEVYNLQ